MTVSRSFPKSLIVITGASSGIGAALARKFSAEGHALLLLARRVEKLQALGLPNCLCKKLDVNDTKAFIAALGEAEAAYGPVQCLINNAGLMLLGSIQTQDPQEWQQMFNTNVLALLGCTQAVVGGMKQHRSGTIINISSVAGRKALPNHGAYCGTKFAVSAMSENLREEMAPHNVRVISICPGATESELISHTTSREIIEGYESWKDEIGGAIRAEDIANTAHFVFAQPENVCIREVVIAPTMQQP
ncbi:SDR family oxidoreductase [Polycladidibacter hongkongensis]|uniref:SDR family oxidoreductase n=1 Tax=Polycladidibacter hongkongensis TaxID=1647556 RepID=UPI00082E3D83|nr:SDR family oxidoreductase [Pseudovibrio hongkongensis]